MVGERVGSVTVRSDTAAVSAPPPHTPVSGGSGDASAAGSAAIVWGRRCGCSRFWMPSPLARRARNTKSPPAGGVVTGRPRGQHDRGWLRSGPACSDHAATLRNWRLSRAGRENLRHRARTCPYAAGRVPRGRPAWRLDSRGQTDRVRVAGAARPCPRWPREKGMV